VGDTTYKIENRLAAGWRVCVFFVSGRAILATSIFKRSQAKCKQIHLHHVRFHAGLPLLLLLLSLE
jgi:hypothetical protein